LKSTLSKYQEYLEHCNLCGSGEHSILHHYPEGFYNHKAFITYPWDGGVMAPLTIVKCNGCGLIFQNPRFKAEHLNMIYTDSVMDTIDLESEVKHHKFKPLLSLIESKAKSNVQSPLSMDIGTRFGLLPELLRRMGYDSHGIEFNSIVVDSATQNGFKNVHLGTIDTIGDIMNRLGKQRIHLITMTDVIEHLYDPTRDFSALARFQECGDHMVIQTMNAGSLGYRLFGSWWYYIHAQHTFYFDESMMRRLLDRHGYDITYILKVAPWKNITMIRKVWKEFKLHKKERIRRNQSAHMGDKVWYASGKPTLFDIFTVVARKR